MSILLLWIAATIGITWGAEFDGKIRYDGKGRYDAYMIPPYHSNHASFLELNPTNGTLLMAWFSGTAEGANNCSIVVAHLPQNSSQWSKFTLVSQQEGYSNQNPVLFYDSTIKNFRLYHSHQKAKSSESSDPHGSRGGEGNVKARGESSSTVWTCESQDPMGTQWTKPEMLLSDAGSFDRNRIVATLQYQNLIFPIYYAVEGSENQYSAMDISYDHTTWREYKVNDSNYLVQPSVIRPTPGKLPLLAFFRDRRAENIYWATTDDEGMSWTLPAKTVLPNNNAAIQAHVLMKGKIAMVYNPMTHGRNVIRIALSSDGGSSWPEYRDLESSSDTSDEFSYPSLLQTADGYIHVSYTYKRESIKYSKFMESWIIKKQMKN